MNDGNSLLWRRLTDVRPKAALGGDGLHIPTKGRLKGMSPEDSLFGCEQAVDSLRLKPRLVKAFETSEGYQDSYMQRDALYHLATILSQFPYFPEDEVLNWVQNNVPVDEYPDHGPGAILVLFSSCGLSPK